MSSDRRIGVYVCWCGGNISDVVDVKKVVEVISKEPNVVVAKDFMFMCSDAGQKMIEEDIKEKKLDAVVVASCSPKLHELTFRGAVTRAGLNPYMYYHANIREQVSWAHGNDPSEATRKAIRHIRMAVAYLRHAEPLKKIEVQATRSVLVIGGGIAGLRAALDLSRMGLNVYLVEREPFVGGNTAKLWEVYPYGRKGWEIVNSILKELLNRDNVAIYTNAEVRSVSGYIGNFEVEVEVRPRGFRGKCGDLERVIRVCPVKVPNEYDFGLTSRCAVIAPPYPGAYPDVPFIDWRNCEKCGRCAEVCDQIELDDEAQIVRLRVGAIITATGFRPYEPKQSEYGYGSSKSVLTLPQFMKLVERSDSELKLGDKAVRTVVFIYCVGSREIPTGEEKVNSYCSRYCCNAVMNLSVRILDKFNGLKLYHLFRDIRTYGKHELMYEEACKRGVVFIKYDENQPPEVLTSDGKAVVKVKDLLTEGEELEIPSDLVVLVTGMEPAPNEKLNEILKLPIGRDGFYQEVHPKLRPVETTLAGMFIAGACQGPKDIRESVLSASAAAAKAAASVLSGRIELEPFVAFVDPERCNLSRRCIDECPYGAIQIKRYENLGEKAWVNEALCKGCGACVAVCPSGAINIRGLTNTQVEEMIKAAGREAT